MNKLYTTLLIACIAVGFTACNDDDCDDLHLGNLANYPNVLKGTFPTEDQVLELGETLEITPELLNPKTLHIHGFSMEKRSLLNKHLLIRSIIHVGQI